MHFCKKNFWKNYRLTPFFKPTDSDAWKLCIEKFNSAKKEVCE